MAGTNKTIETQQEEDLTTIAADLVTRAKPGTVFCLKGPLGTGKTSFARAFIRSYLKDPHVHVTSPTFNLMQPYGLNQEIWHIDLYRLKDARELEALGLEELMERSILLIEWPEIAASLLPKNIIQLEFSYIPNKPNARKIKIEYSS